jgi:glycine dehydrogenase subunit 1
MRQLQELAGNNTGAGMTSFLGAGNYAHHIPPAVDQLLLRSEFYTAYTPYQPEVAQGTLQAIWEFQTIVSELFGLGLSNASMYDGASAAAEGVQMARRLTRRSKVVVSKCVHPQYREVVRTMLWAQGQPCIEVDTTPDGVCDVAAIRALLSDDLAACLVGHPSFGGGLHDLQELAGAVHGAGALLVSSTTEPYALAVAKSPGEMDVDIATGEGQALACPPTFGGPGVGLFACRDDRKYLQQMPGRICGETVDKEGQRGFVLTLSTREQHIRRERATSNICTNQGLLALSMTIRVSMLGKSGFVQTAEQCLAKARYLRDRIAQLDGFELVGNAPIFNEFRVRVLGKSVPDLVAASHAQGVIPGLPLYRVDPSCADQLLIAVTEQHTRAELDRLVSVLGS